MSKNKIVIVAGGPYAGKTTLINDIVGDDTAHFCLLTSEMFIDSPYVEDFDFATVSGVLRSLQQGMHAHVGGKEITPADVIIYEDRFGLYNMQLRCVADLTIYVDAEVDEMLVRGTAIQPYRHAEFVANWAECDGKMYHDHIAGTKKYADIITRGETNRVDRLIRAFCGLGRD